MVCKYDELLATLKSWGYAEDEEAVKETFEVLSHPCKYIKSLPKDDMSGEDVGEMAQYALAVMDEAYEHEYSLDDVIEVASGVFDELVAKRVSPKHRIAFVMVVVMRL